MAYTRANAWNHGGTFDNQDLFWYARGVAAMQARPLSDRRSWWFFAALHGHNLTPGSAPPWAGLHGPPAVPTDPPAADADQKQFWNQCQHQSWFFLPWHRGFLHALELQLRADILASNGPQNWALPYWDYLAPKPQYCIPPAFTQPTLQDGTANPLYVAARYGPGGGKVYVCTEASALIADADAKCLNATVFTNPNDPASGFGGPETAFSHGGNDYGLLEANPHMAVHTNVGGLSPDGNTQGWMAVTSLAALDPIFALHHANIDRMWAAWNTKHPNPADTPWLNGPTDRPFVMPLPDGTAWRYAPRDVTGVDLLGYDYDFLPGVLIPPDPLPARLATLQVAPASIPALVAKPRSAVRHTELVGASEQPAEITCSGMATEVRLDPRDRARLSASLDQASTTGKPDRAYLVLENVRGALDAVMLRVAVNLPEGAKLEDHPECLAGSVSLFGLTNASRPDSPHGGAGLHFRLEITAVIDRLHLEGALMPNALTGAPADALTIALLPSRTLPDGETITIGRLALYRRGV